MGTSTATATEAEMRAWTRFAATYATITREIETKMLDRHGLTLTAYDALLQLSRADDRAMRNVELANTVLLTRSGVTRLVEALEAQGLVTRCSCTEDRRGTKVSLTEAGRERLAEASATHVEGVRELFLRRLAPAERRQLDELLSRMPGAECRKACSVPPADRALGRGRQRRAA